MSQIENYINENFQLLAGDLSPAKALCELVTDNYGVVVNQLQKPVALVIADDLKQAANQGATSLLDIEAGFPPTIIVGHQVNMQDLVKSKVRITLNKETRGAIVINDDTVVGILAVTTVREYLGSGEYQQQGKTMGDIGAVGETALAGRHQPPKCLVQCAECGYVNELSFLDRRKLPTCQNDDPNVPTHKLKLP